MLEITLFTVESVFIAVPPMKWPPFNKRLLFADIPKILSAFCFNLPVPFLDVFYRCVDPTTSNSAITVKAIISPPPSPIRPPLQLAPCLFLLDLLDYSHILVNRQCIVTPFYKNHPPPRLKNPESVRGMCIHRQRSAPCIPARSIYTSNSQVFY